jgi:ferredoxin
MNSTEKTPLFTVHLQKEKWCFEAPMDSTVLDAALASGINLPNSCRNGSCRTCICRLVSGQIAYKIVWPGLSKEEKEEGMILPCVAIALTDLVLDVSHASKMI